MNDETKPQQYRKKPVVVTAYRTTMPQSIETLEGTMQATPGDWIITGLEGEQYPCKDSIFRTSYESATDAGQVE